MLLSVWKFGTASGFYTQTKFGMEDLFLCCPAPRHGGSEILAVVTKVTKHGVVLESWAEGLRGFAQPGLLSTKGLGILDQSFFLWHNRVTGLLFRLGAARNKFSVCPHQKLVNVNRGQVQYQFPMGLFHFHFHPTFPSPCLSLPERVSSLPEVRLATSKALVMPGARQDLPRAPVCGFCQRLRVEGFTEPCLIKKTQVIIHCYRFYLVPQGLAGDVIQFLFPLRSFSGGCLSFLAVLQSVSFPWLGCHFKEQGG